MNNLNSYNCTKPGNLFVGYERLRKHIVNGLHDGNSYAIMGGRRCGKTSMLLQFERELSAEGLTPFKPLPRYLDLQALVPSTPEQLFEAIYTLVTLEIGAEPWQEVTSSKEYQFFLHQMDKAKPLLEQKYGADWLAILLVDELDVAITTLRDDQFFQNLRNLLMVSRFHRHFRLVATGVKELANLISSGSSPLNNLRHQYLRSLTGIEARQLVKIGFTDGLDSDLELLLFQLTGRHPYLLQGLLEKMWGTQTAWDKAAVKNAAREFLREHTDFQRWLDAFGPAEHAVYQCLLEATDGKREINEIRNRIDPRLIHKIDEALIVLSYHGVIDDSVPDQPELVGTMFRDWYRNHIPKQYPVSTVSPSKPSDTEPRSRSADPAGIHIEVSPKFTVGGATSTIQLGFDAETVIKLIEELKNEIATLALGARDKMEAQHALDEGAIEVKEPASGKQPNKEVVKAALEKTTKVLKAAGATAASAHSFIEKVKKLAPYIGISVEWIARLFS